MTVTTGVEADGTQAVVVKRGSAATVEQLRLEGERLRRASHPGVVQVLRSAPAGDGWELRTAHAGRPLSILAPVSVPQAAAIVAAAASTLADLHQLGLVHGRVDASHVLLGEQGRPVLCGFGDGRPGARPEDDVAALGGLLTNLLGGDDDAEPIPERRWRRRRTWTGWERRALLLLADQACADPATRRPTARRLAAAITEAVPDIARLEPPSPDAAVVPPGEELDPIESLRASAPDDTRARPVRPTVLALAVVGAVLLVIGLRRPSDPPRDPAPPMVDEAPATSSTVGAQHTATPAADSVVVIDGHRYRVGQDGDEVLVDDWDCDGSPTPALLRPATGEVFVFPRWVDHRLEVEPVLVVAGAEALVSVVSTSGCPTLLVRTPSGDVPALEPGSL